MLESQISDVKVDYDEATIQHNTIIDKIEKEKQNLQKKWVEVKVDNIYDASQDDNNNYNNINNNNNDNDNVKRERKDNMDDNDEKKGDIDIMINSSNDRPRINNQLKQMDKENSDKNYNNSNNNRDRPRINRLREIDKEIESLHGKLANRKTIICIGNTGLGKSTFLNRFLGDKSKKGDKGPFKVGHGLESQTNLVSHTFCRKNNINFCIVDTPGNLDSFNRDDQHNNNIARYLHGCGGINAFLIFVSLAASRVDQTYINLLNLYSTMLDDDKWWDHVIIVGTKFDVFKYNNEDELEELDDNGKQKFYDDKMYMLYIRFLLYTQQLYNL